MTLLINYYPFATRYLISSRLVALIALMNTLTIMHSQNIHDLNHSKQFADYLYKTGQFQLASEEFERIVFLDSTNQNLKLKLINSYRKAENYSLALNRINLFFGEQLFNLPADFAEEYVKLLMFTKQDSLAYLYLSLNKTLIPSTRQNYQLGSLLLQKKWGESFQYAMKYPVSSDKKNADLHLLAFEAKQLKYKKPGVAALMSFVIPGSGKAYTRNWKDAAISFIFVSVNAWQSYRGFNKYGTESVYGWVFAGLASGFYIGNIYGSAKSAKKYNKKIDDELYHKVRHIVLDDM
ncbi:MAG: hypothetical protein ABFS35_04580 [Bacteroidota bacterium]